MIKPGHTVRVRYTIESHENDAKPLFKISALLRCGEIIVSSIRSKLLERWEPDATLLCMADRLEKKRNKHFKGCKTCRIAKRKMRNQ